jgi:hypothetical protein
MDRSSITLTTGATVKLTPREIEIIEAILTDDYNNSEETGTPWSWSVCEDQADAAVFGSLVKKGVCFTQGRGGDAFCGFTKEAQPAIRSVFVEPTQPCPNCGLDVQVLRSYSHARRCKPQDAAPAPTVETPAPAADPVSVETPNPAPPNVAFHLFGSDSSGVKNCGSFATLEKARARAANERQYGFRPSHIEERAEWGTRFIARHSTVEPAADPEPTDAENARVAAEQDRIEEEEAELAALRADELKHDIKCRKTTHGAGGGMYDVYRVSCAGETLIGSVQRWWNAETGGRGRWINSATGRAVYFKTKGEAVAALVHPAPVEVPAESTDSQESNEPTSLYPAHAPRCQSCARPFSPQEARAGYTICEHCPPPADPEPATQETPASPTEPRTFEEGRQFARATYAEMDAHGLGARSWARVELKTTPRGDYFIGYHVGLKQCLDESDAAAQAAALAPDRFGPSRLPEIVAIQDAAQLKAQQATVRRVIDLLQATAQEYPERIPAMRAVLRHLFPYQLTMPDGRTAAEHLADLLKSLPEA